MYVSKLSLEVNDIACLLVASLLQWRRKIFWAGGLTFREANSVGISSQPSMEVRGHALPGNFLISHRAI